MALATEEAAYDLGRLAAATETHMGQFPSDGLFQRGAGVPIGDS